MAARSFTRGFAPLRRELQCTKSALRYQHHARNLIFSSGRTGRASLSQARQYSSQTPDAQRPRFHDLRSQLNSSHPPPHPSSQTTQTKQKRSLRPAIYATAFLLLGLSLGNLSSALLSPPPLPTPLSPSGLQLTSALRTAAEALPLSKSMAGEDWDAWDAYTTPSAEKRANRLTSGPLAGYGGIGYQRVFHNKGTGEYVVLVWFGKGLGGWPGVVHGGLLATVLDECLARAGMGGLCGGTGVTARLEVGFKRPVGSGGWWVVRSWREEGEVMMNGGTRSGNGNARKSWARGQVEDLSGTVYTEARGLYVAPKNVKLCGMGEKF